LDHGADLNAVDEYGFNALDTALELNDDPAILKVLVDAGATVDNRYPGRLWVALDKIGCWYSRNSISDDDRKILLDRDLSLIKMLLDRVADSSMINLPWGSGGHTPLHNLLYHCNQYWPNLPAIQLILDYGGYNRIKCRDGFTPLEMAARLGYQEFVQLLRVYDEKLPPEDEI
jgi:ankyrin repeat protein